MVETEICYMVGEKEGLSAGESSSRAARRKRMEIRKFKFVTGVPTVGNDNGFKKPRLTISPASMSRGCGDKVENRSVLESKLKEDRAEVATTGSGGFVDGEGEGNAKFGVASVCGRRREMEDAVAIHPSFNDDRTSNMHYFGVYDGHGCSHVARRCKARLHLLVKEELYKNDWKNTMEKSFRQMDEEVTTWNQQAINSDCRCELHAPESYGVGSTAVVSIVTPDKIIVGNCGDSRAVLCRNGKAVPLSTDHKPDSPEELKRIEAAGGKVLYWDGARVCGILATSRAIGDGYLKPYVACEPEVTITDRTVEDECLILASDGLWDVVSNETACGLASLCLKGNGPSKEMKSPPANEVSEYENCDRACSNAALLLTKLALARGSADNVSVVVVDLRKNGSL